MEMTDVGFSQSASSSLNSYYMGLCDPLEDTESLIRETAGYIEDTERLAEADPIMARDAARVCAK